MKLVPTADLGISISTVPKTRESRYEFHHTILITIDLYPY